MLRRDWLERLSVAAARLRDELREHDVSDLRPLRAGIEDLHARLGNELARERCDHPRLLVFLCGTTLMHSGGVGQTREERVAQARTGTDPSLTDYATYVATEGATEKLRSWSDQGAEILYLSYHRDPASLDVSSRVVRASGFPPGAVLARAAGESYDDVVERAAPDLLIEDDCTSTGSDSAYRQLGETLRDRVGSIIVPEFGGLAHLPTNLNTLLGCTA